MALDATTTMPREVAVDAQGDVVPSREHRDRPPSTIGPRESSRVVDDDGRLQAEQPQQHHHQQQQQQQQDPTLEAAAHRARDRQGAPEAALLASIRDELAGIERLVKLQELRIDVLAGLRETLLDSRARGPERERPPFDEMMSHRPPRASTATDTTTREAIARRLDAVVAEHLAAAAGARFDALFVERELLPVPDDAVDLDLATIPRLPDQELVTVATRGGAVHIRLAHGAPGAAWHVLDTGLEGVVQIAVDVTAEPPLLAVIARRPTPQLVTFALELIVRGRSVFATGPEPIGNEDKGSHGPTSTPLVVQTRELGRLPLAAEPVALVLTRSSSSRRSIVGVATSDGRLRFLAANGTLLREHPANVPAPGDLAIFRNRLAVAEDRDVAILPLHRQAHSDGEWQRCGGSRARVVSMAFDRVHPGLLYAGTDHGEVLVHGLPGHPASDGATCRLAHRAIVPGRPRTQAPVAVVTTRGYVVAASGTTVSLWNATGDASALQRVTEFRAPVPLAVDGRSGRPLLALAEGLTTTTIGFVVVHAQDGTKSLMLWQSLLVTRSEASDWPLWRGAMMVAIVLGVVLYVQYSLRRQRRPGGDSPFNGATASGDDWAKLLARANREGSGDAYIARNRRPPREHDVAQALHEARSYESPAKRRDVTPRERFGDVDAMALRQKVAEARRETLECAFDEDEFEDEY